MLLSYCSYSRLDHALLSNDGTMVPTVYIYNKYNVSQQLTTIILQSITFKRKLTKIIKNKLSN